MRRDQDVARQGADLLDARAEAVGDRGEAEIIVGGEGGQAVGIDDVEAFAGFAGFPAPAGAARRMARRAGAPSR